MEESKLQVIRERFSYAKEAWKDIRDEGAKDMRYISGDPWDPKEKQARKDADRPCLVMDELSQYVNQLINDVRQNKRSIKIIPQGSGANDKTAGVRQGLIRQVEFSSNGQAAYETAFENAAQRSYGWFGLTTKYVGEESFNQELRLLRIPNPDTIYPDPDFQQADASDMNWLFQIEPLLLDEFKRKYPSAEVKDFSDAHRALAPQWLSGTHVQVAQYWEVQKTMRDLLLLDDPTAGPVTHYLDEMPAGTTIKKGYLLLPDGAAPTKIIKRRKSEQRRVVQYITNGIEILEENPWAGSWIPRFPVFGKEMYLTQQDGTSKRTLVSLVRLARDPYMLYCFYRTCEAEVVSMTPKTPFIGYEGQFAGHEADWKNINKVPIPYLQVVAVPDGSQGTLPLPQRQPYEPAIQSLEMGAEAAKRAIQSAMGRYNTSVGRADTKASSGVAIKALDSQSDQGSFHFIDNYDRALEHCGRAMNELIPKIYDTAREVGIRKQDDTFETVKLNEPYESNGEQLHYKTDEGDHDVTVSTGPSYQSQRDEANSFVDQLASTPQFTLVADLLVKLKDLGPIGDEIAERLTPPQFAAKDGKQPLPPRAQKAVQQLQQQVQSLNSYAKTLESQISKLSAMQKAKLLELQSKERIAFMQAQVDIIKAEITAKKDIEGPALLERLKSEFASLASSEERAAELEAQLENPSQDEAAPSSGAATS